MYRRTKGVLLVGSLANKIVLSRRQAGGHAGRRDRHRTDGGARKGHRSPALLRDRFFKIDQLHLPVIESHRPVDPDIHHPLERDKHHPVGLARHVPTNLCRRYVMGRCRLPQELHRQAPALRHRLGRGAGTGRGRRSRHRSAAAQALASHDGEEFNVHQGVSHRDAARSRSRAPLLSPRVEQTRLVGEWRRHRRRAAP
jgi:hypothetical protein